MPSLGRLQGAADLAVAFVERGDEGPAVERQRQRAADLGIVEGRGLAIHQDVGVVVHRRRLAHHPRRLAADVAQLRDRHLPGKGHVEAAGHEAQQRRRRAGDDVELDAVEMRLARLEVVGIAHQPDAVELLERVELERPGADRLDAHLGARHVAGIDRREPRGEQRQQRGLRMVEMDGDFVVVAAVDVVDVAVPGCRADCGAACRAPGRSAG